MLAAPAHATFTTVTTCGDGGCPGDLGFFNSAANKGVTNFVGSVGVQSGGPAVTVEPAIGSVDTGAGYATIKPVKGGTLDSLEFTPANPLDFSDFSFRGQIDNTGFNDVLTVTVVGCMIVSSSCSPEAPQTFTLTTDKGANADFSRLGIVSTDGETILSVTVNTASGASFKEFKQVDFSPAVGVVLHECPRTRHLGDDAGRLRGGGRDDAPQRQDGGRRRLRPAIRFT